MNSISDVGGLHGLGPVEREDEESVFHADWERRVFGIRGTGVPAEGEGPRQRRYDRQGDQYVRAGCRTYDRGEGRRSRIVTDPRRTPREDFGLDVPEEVEIRVWDSSAEIRYWVLPERPSGTEGMTEEELAALVTRDAMIGVGRARAPEPSRR